MLVARDATGGRRVAAAAPAEDFFCPACSSKLIVRAGASVVAHFAHRPGQRCSSAELKLARRKRAAERRAAARAAHRDLAEQVEGQQSLFG